MGLTASRPPLLAALLLLAAAAAAADGDFPERIEFAEDGWCVWCPAPFGWRGGDYLFYSRWPQSRGFRAWVTDSEIALAKLGPDGRYRHVKTVLSAPGRCYHNPAVLTADGRLYLYYMGTGGGPGDDWWAWRNRQNVYVTSCETPEGDWKPAERPLFDTAALGVAMCSNPTVYRLDDGAYAMLYKYVEKLRPAPFYGPVRIGIARAAAPDGPFVPFRPDAFARTGSDFPCEDTFVWKEDGLFRCLVHDMGTNYSPSPKSLIRFTSANGLDWTNPEPYRTKGGFDRLERPCVYRRRLFMAVKPGAADARSLILAEPLPGP